MTNAISFGMMKAAARVRYSFSFSVMSALVGTLAFSTAAAVLTRIDARFLRMLSAVMLVSYGMDAGYRVLQKRAVAP